MNHSGPELAGRLSSTTYADPTSIFSPKQGRPTRRRTPTGDTTRSVRRAHGLSPRPSFSTGFTPRVESPPEVTTDCGVACLGNRITPAAGGCAISLPAHRHAQGLRLVDSANGDAGFCRTDRQICCRETARNGDRRKSQDVKGSSVANASRILKSSNSPSAIRDLLRKTTASLPFGTKPWGYQKTAPFQLRPPSASGLPRDSKSHVHRRASVADYRRWSKPATFYRTTATFARLPGICRFHSTCRRRADHPARDPHAHFVRRRCQEVDRLLITCLRQHPHIRPGTRIFDGEKDVLAVGRPVCVDKRVVCWNPRRA